MKKISAASLVIAAAVAFAGCGDNSAAPENDTSAVQTEAENDNAENTEAENTEDEPETSGAQFNDLGQEEFTAALGLGWNLGNQLEAFNGDVPSETAWGNPEITEDLLKAVKEQGFSTVRIPVSYFTKIGEAPDYTVDPDWLDRIAQVVDYVVDNDMYAIVNMHGDGYYTINGAWLLCAEDDEAQVQIKEKYKAVWGQVAEKFKDYDEHLIFESMNEEFNNDYGKPDPAAYANINDYNQIFVDTVRETGSNNAKRWLLVPGWNTNIDYTAGDYGFVIPSDSRCEAEGSRLMISVHYYDPYNFTIDENITSAKTQWGKYAVEDYDNWGQEDYVDAQMKKLNDTFVSKGFPVIIGELGVQDKAFMSEDFPAFRCYWAEYVVKAAKNNGCVPVYWDNGWNGQKGLAVFDRTTKEVTQPELIEAMVRAINSDGDYEIAHPEGFETER